MIRAVALCLFLLSFSAIYSQTKYSLTVVVKNEKGQEIKSVSVRILNQSKVPLINNENFIFDDLLVGNYEIYVTAENYSSKIIPIKVDNTKTIEVILNREYRILDDIVISSDKKETTLMKDGSSSSAFTSKQIKELRIWKLNDLSGLAPNLYLGNSGDNRNVTSIRGITTTSYEQAVATYIDGVAQFGLDTYIPQLNDIESIEVIRGIQSTYYGRNAFGGVINITTKQPTERLLSNLDMQFGSFGQKRFNAAIKTPIIKKKLYGSVSFLHDSRNGYYNNDYTKTDYDRQNQNIINLHLKYLINNTWSLQADHKQYFAKNNGAFPLVADLDELFKNPFRLSQNQVTTMRDKTTNTSLVLKHSGKKTNLVLQSALQYNYRYYENTLDADFSPFEIVGIFNNYGKGFNKVNVFTNEFRISSKNDVSSKIEWNTGVYHYHQYSPTKQATVFGKDAGFMGIPDKNFSLISTNIARNNGLAGYGDLKIIVSEKIKLIGGLRIDNEWRNLSVNGQYEKQPNLQFVTRTDTSARTQYTALSPRFGLQYVGSQTQILYVNVSRGFRSGGLSGITSDPSQLPLWAYKPEYSNMIELGFKGQNNSKSMRYSFAVFYTQINNIQSPRLILPDAVTVTQNSGRLNSSGLEAELIYKPAKGLILQYSGGLTNAKFSSLNGVSNGATIDLSNKRQIFTPKSTNFLSAQYQLKLGKSEIMFRTEYNRIGEQYFDLENKISQKAYGLLNFRCGIKFKEVDIFLWGRNLNQVRYISYAYDFGAAHLGEPRMIGAGISLKNL